MAWAASSAYIAARDPGRHAVGHTGRACGCTVPAVEHIDGASLYFDDEADPQAEAGSVDAGRWSSKAPVNVASTWSFSSPTSPWTSTEPLASLHSGTTYVLYGWTNDNSGSTAEVAFTLADLKDLRPGQVRYFAGSNAAGDQALYRTGSVSDFRAYACGPDGRGAERPDRHAGMTRAVDLSAAWPGRSPSARQIRTGLPDFDPEFMSHCLCRRVIEPVKSKGLAKESELPSLPVG